jgi:hypothetical protein
MSDEPIERQGHHDPHRQIDHVEGGHLPHDVMPDVSEVSAVGSRDRFH